MIETIKLLKYVFDIVRLVDVNDNAEFFIEDDGSVSKKETKCFQVWGKENRCVNCISAQAYGCKGQMEKFEFIGDDSFYVIAKYFEYQGNPYVLEMVNKLKDKSFGSVDKHLFANQIKEYDKKLYIDPLTGAYNRLYFNEQLQNLDQISAIAMFDVDNFKHYNDTFGHQFGDEVLKTISELILESIRNTDAYIRYGGDEFIIVFSGIPRRAFEEKLEQIRLDVEKLSFENYPEVKVTLSIGGIMSTSCDELAVKLVDECLYEAKKDKNKVVIK